MALGATMLPEDAPAQASGVKHLSVAILASSPEVSDFISWRLWDPFFLQAGIPNVSVGVANGSVDLLILGDSGLGHGAVSRESTEALDGFVSNIEHARGVIAVQPAALKAPLSAALASRMGVRFQKWDYQTPAQGVRTHRAQA
jgi:hypothetical protein